MTDKEKAQRRFFASVDEITTFISQCSVCKNVDGLNCKALKGRRPEKYYMNDNPEFQRCHKFNFDSKSFSADEYRKLSKGYKYKC